MLVKSRSRVTKIRPSEAATAKTRSVALSGQLLVASEGNIVTSRPKNARYQVRKIFIELDGSHDQAVTGTTLSRARSAAYANAAGMASLGNPG